MVTRVVPRDGEIQTLILSHASADDSHIPVTVVLTWASSFL
jgi:hypothetical protein